MDEEGVSNGTLDYLDFPDGDAPEPIGVYVALVFCDSGEVIVRWTHDW